MILPWARPLSLLQCSHTVIVSFRHLSPRKSFSGQIFGLDQHGSSDCRRAEKDCIVNNNHLNNMACLLLSSNMAPLFAASQLWPPLFSWEGKGDLCFQLRPINWLPLLLLFLLLASFFYNFFIIWCMYGARTWNTSLSASKFMFVFRWNFSFPFPLLADFSVCLIPPSPPSDWPFLLPFRHEKTTRGESLRQQVGGLFERLFGLISESGFLVSICGAVKHQVLNNSS